MPKNNSEEAKQGQLEAHTYGAGGQFESHPYYYASSKDLERELQSEDKPSGQPSTPTKANDKARRQPCNEETQARHSHGGVKKLKHGGHNTKEFAPPDPFLRMQREGDHDMQRKFSGALA